MLVVDEMGSWEEVRACRSIAQRGVIIVAAAHGASLKGLITNDELSVLVGGVHDVVISDIQARCVTNLTHAA